MKLFQPIKTKGTGRVIGYFYRLRNDGMLQYLSFSSSVESIEPDKVEPATPTELQATKERQRAAGKRG
jgi:hypothetical protein